MKSISYLFIIFTGQAALAMSSVVAAPPRDVQCNHMKSLNDVMAQVRLSPSIAQISDQTLLELLIATSCEATVPKPDHRMMALGEAIFVGSTQKKSVLFCGDNVRKMDEQLSTEGFAHIFLDDTHSGELTEESTDHLAQYNVKVKNGKLEAMNFNGASVGHFAAKAGEFVTTSGFTKYDLSCEILD